ncbi:MAG: TonB family protein [Planctomycetota bacterium]|nr:TonB family protein [Planctomycetota bacterium]
MINGTVFQLGGIKISALTVGIVGSVVVHGAILACSYLVITSSPAHDEIQAEPLYARGEPIQIRLVEAELTEVVPDESGVELDTEVTTHEEVMQTPLEPIESPELPDPTPEETSLPELPTESIDDTNATPRIVHEIPPSLCDVLLGSLSQAVDYLETQHAERSAQPITTSPTREPLTTNHEVAQPQKKTTRTKPIRTPVAKTVTQSKPTQTKTQSPAPSVPVQSGAENGAEAQDLPRPDYPSRSIRRGQEGVVLVKVQVLANGRVGEVKVHTSSGHRLLDKAALDAARKGRFQPARRDGVPYTSHVVVPFEFKLR